MELLEQYLRRLSAITQRGDATELSYYSALEDLFKKIAALQRRKIDITTLPKRTEGGNPDFRVWDGKHKHVGYIEAKVPAEDLSVIERSEQLKRYRSTFPNVLLTNFYEFRLYRDAELMDNVQIGRPFIAKKLGTVAPLENADKFMKLIAQFFDFSIPSLTTARALALELAKRTRFLRDQVIVEELREGKQNDLLGFYEAFKKHLISSLTLEDFADLYAQTITYGLFIARHRFDTTPNLFEKGDTEKAFRRELAYKLIPKTLGILQDVFRFLSSSEPPQQLSVTSEDIAEVLAAADLKKIEQEFFHTKRGKDPIVHFYETFLAHYDPAKREKRGVYYTPEPVVSYIVRSLHYFLKEEFGKPDGFASQDVTVLDPASGTQTFPATAMHLAAEEYTEKYGKGGLDQLISDHILKNFYAFELMMAPYAIGHLKIAYVLEELGYKMKEDERFKLFLTNTLEWDDLSQTQIPHLASLSEESKHAAAVKKDVPIMVIMGNPPYSGISDNKGKWITGLIETYKYVDGKHFGERKHWLNDDYVKFIRFAQWKIEQAGQGIVGMITNHGYLDNPTFRGMRQSLMNAFTDIYVLDLHGNSLKNEKTPEGGKDENVFDIQQGVAITLFVKNPKKKLPGKVHHAELWGERENKYLCLDEQQIGKEKWEKLSPNSPSYYFVPSSENGRDEYERLPQVTRIFPTYSTAIQTSRDDFAIAATRGEMQRRLQMFTDLSIPNEIIESALNAKEMDFWKLSSVRKKMKDAGIHKGWLTNIAYRPFDIRVIYFDDLIVHRTKKEVMQHMLGKENLSLLISRQLATSGFQHAFCTNLISEMCVISTKTKEQNYVFPLYLYPAEDAYAASLFDQVSADRKPNFSEEVLAELKHKLKKEPKPEEFFAYVYAILYSPEYRKRYAEFLKSDFPRIPITSNEKLFDGLAMLGQELIGLHLLKSKILEKPITKFEGNGEAKAEKRKYDEKKHAVWINDRQHFERIPVEVWEYQIGGYQVLDKWLKDRKDRILSSEDIRHYCRIVTALAETIKVQKEIDEVIQKSGGFPIL